MQKRLSHRIHLVVVGQFRGIHFGHQRPDLRDDATKDEPPGDHGNDRKHTLGVRFRANVPIANRTKRRKGPVQSADVPC